MLYKCYQLLLLLLLFIINNLRMTKVTRRYTLLSKRVTLYIYIYIPAHWLELRNSNPKTMGSIPWRGRIRNSCSVPPSQRTLVQTCLCLTPPPPPSCVRHTLNINVCAQKDPISICRKRLGTMVS